MPHTSAPPIFFLTLSAGIALSAPAFADTKEASHDHDHSHAHDHAHDQDDIYKGYFDDAQIKDRPLSDWAGEWQSVYPLLQQGALDEVMQHKAEGSDKTAAEYKTYYDVGYATDVNRITIEGNAVTFFRDGDPVQGRYASDGYEVLTYEKATAACAMSLPKRVAMPKRRALSSSATTSSHRKRPITTTSIGVTIAPRF